MTLNQALKALECRVSYCEEEKSAIHRALWDPPLPEVPYRVTSRSQD